MPHDLMDWSVECESRWVDEEVTRLFHLSDRFLGRAIIGTARTARSFREDGFAHHAVPLQLRHAAALVWDIGPEIARRLGETDIRPGEIRTQVRAASDGDLRHWTWRCLQRTATIFIAPDSDHGGSFDAWKLLLNDPSNGNPLFVALDRLAPPENTQDDICARYIAARDRSRGWGNGRTMWAPSEGTGRIRLSAEEIASVPLAPR